jgi:hypothetical protein
VDDVPDPWLDGVKDDIKAYACRVMLVSSDSEDAPPFGYSIGLAESHGHPEVVLMSWLDLNVQHQIINLCADLVRHGAQLADGDESDDVLEGYRVAFRTVDPTWHGALFGQALRYYQGDMPRVLQCVLPDRENRFPWDEGYDTQTGDGQLPLWEPLTATPVDLVN